MATDAFILQRLGGDYQLVLDHAEQLPHIVTLDEAHWVATSAPVDSLICDQAFLAHMDHDENGRIRTDELRTAQKWLFHMLADRSELSQRIDRLRLAAIDTAHVDGQSLHAAALRILENLHAEDRTCITLAQVRSRGKIVSSGAANGDGVIPPEAVDDEALQTFIGDMLKTVGGEDDASGLKGVTEAGLNTFLTEAQAYLDWKRQTDADNEADYARVMVWGEDTPAAFQALTAVEERLENYFALCAMLQLDERAGEFIRLDPQQIAKLDFNDAAAVRAAMTAAPLARPTPDATLPLDDRINPIYRARMQVFAAEVLAKPGADASGTLSRSLYGSLKTQLAPYRDWQAAKGGATVEALGEAQLREYLDSPLPGKLRAIMAEDKAAAHELEQVHTVEKLILYQQWFLELVNNFVAFPHLYNPAKRSLIESGTLVMDGRHFSLCVNVTDRKRHKEIAKKSHICLLYLDISSQKDKKDKGKSFSAAAAVTAGTTLTLYKGKTGIFFTADGQEWDATVADILENPVGLWEAMVRPFQKLGEFIAKQAEKFSASRYTDVEKRVGKTISEADKSASKPATSKASAPKPGSSATRDLLLGGGAAVFGLGAALSSVLATIKDVSLVHWLYLILGVFCIVALPTIIVAVVKLRRRNLAMVLEACGWAVNAKLGITHRMGRLFTRTPALPKEAQRQHIDLTRKFSVDGDVGRSTFWLVVALGVLIASTPLWWKYTQPKKSPPPKQPPVESKKQPPAATEKKVAPPPVVKKQ